MYLTLEPNTMVGQSVLELLPHPIALILLSSTQHLCITEIQDQLLNIIIKNRIIGQCNFRALIGLAIIAYEPLHHALQML